MPCSGLGSAGSGVSGEVRELRKILKSQSVLGALVADDRTPRPVLGDCRVCAARSPRLHRDQLVLCRENERADARM